MRKALGRGIEALIPKEAPAAEIPAKAKVGSPVVVPIEKIRPSHMQPRKNFDPEKLSQLAATIKEHGLAQPILVSVDGESGNYELIAGERRLRAARLAGLTEIEVTVRQPKDDKDRLMLALVENLQRENLNPIETALGYLRLMKEHSIAQSDLVQKMGKSKSAISNTLRLLDLPEDIQKGLQVGDIKEGHARALLSVENPLEKHRLFRLAVDQDLSVREVEDLARKVAGGDTLEKSDRRKPAPKPSTKSPDIRSLETTLQQILGTKVEIKTRKDPSTGSITIHYYSHTDFERIVGLIKK